jgi:cell fate regulator YaaT (PSP1 superfamily)
MPIIIGVQFHPTGKIYDFDPTTHLFQPGDPVIVETSRGIELATVRTEAHWVPPEDIEGELKPIVRPAGDEDLRIYEENLELAKEAADICTEKIALCKLDMKLVNVEYTLDRSRIIFNFTADNRVDFRALVKELAGVFHTRIELRQIGVRDEAKILGGIGICGQPLCCSRFLCDFNPVSIKMAKEQNLSLNPTKISGCCGRLLCCLNYENAHYEERNRNERASKAAVEAGLACPFCPQGAGSETEPVPDNAETRHDEKRLKDIAATQVTVSEYKPSGEDRKHRSQSGSALRDKNRRDRAEKPGSAKEGRDHKKNSRPRPAKPADKDEARAAARENRENKDAAAQKARKPRHRGHRGGKGRSRKPAGEAAKTQAPAGPQS